MDTAIFVLSLFAFVFLSIAIFNHLSKQRQNASLSVTKRSYIQLKVLSIVIIACVPLLSTILNFIVPPLSWKSIYRPDEHIFKSKHFIYPTYTPYSIPAINPANATAFAQTHFPTPTETQTPEPTSTITPTARPTMGRARFNISPDLYLDENSSPNNLRGEHYSEDSYYFTNIEHINSEGNLGEGYGKVYLIGDEEWVAAETVIRLLPSATRLLPAEDNAQQDDIEITQYFVQVWKDGIIMYSQPVVYGSGFPSRLIRYEDHWIYMFQDAGFSPRGRIVRDGVLLNDLYDYDGDFGLQLLDNKPFFFFQRGDQLGFNFNDQEILLPYSNIIFEKYCCDVSIFRNPRGTNEMVGFYTQNEDSSYQYVEIGLSVDTPPSKPTNSPTPTNTLTQTPALTSTPTIEPPVGTTRIDLSDDLYLDENSSLDNLRGKKYLPDYYNYGDGKVFQIEGEEWVAALTWSRIFPFNDYAHPLDGELRQHYVLLFKDGHLEYSHLFDGIGPMPHTLIRYGDHWIFSFSYAWARPGWIVKDGILLNDLYGYDDAFSLYLLDGKPFFFFQQGDQYGINYNDQEILLPYTNIIYHTLCCEISKNWNPRGTEIMVGFYTRMEDSSYQYVEIGLK